MKLGFGLYRHMINTDNLRFARQCGATHIVAHLVDYFNAKEKSNNQPVGRLSGWGRTGSPEPWSVKLLQEVKQKVNNEGLELEAIENLDPAQWHDILLDGPKKKEQLETVKTIIKRMGEVGIPCLGYNFSIAGVAGRTEGPFARGGAISVGMNGILTDPIANGMVWNMTYDNHAEQGTIRTFSHDELWKRLDEFLTEVIPVAEESGVTLAAHPDDPPVPFLRGTPRLVYQPHLYQRLIDLHPSRANMLEFCLGSIAEMTSGDVYKATEQYSRQNRIGYIHFRNVVDKAPNYREVFLDEGDIDMIRILKILKKNHYTGVLIPDHTPLMNCAAPWHAGMAYAMGYMQAALQAL